METNPDWVFALGDGYALLSELFSQGLHQGNLKRVQLSPILQEALDTYGPDRIEQIACDHQHVFGWSIHPYESVFLGERTEIGGDIGPELIRRYRKFRIEMNSTDAEPDHIASELLCLSQLCKRESESIANRDGESASEFRKAQNEIIEFHLLRWLPALRSCVLRSKRALPCALVEQTMSMVLVHYAKLQSELAETSSKKVADFLLPVQPSVLENEHSGLREIAEFLASPALSGIFLSRDDISNLSGSARLPQGFGKRADLLHNLLVAAARFDGIPQVLTQLSNLILSWQREIRILIDEQGPSVQEALLPWLEQSGKTKSILERMLNASKEQVQVAQG